MATPIDMKDFSGGIQESLSASDFSERQWARLKGFVLESEQVIRSQWECQRVSGASSFLAVRAFTTKKDRFLVAIKTDGTIWWCLAPDRTASNATTVAVTWTQVSTAVLATSTTGATTAVPSSTAYRFLTEIQILEDASGYRSGLLIHSLSGTTPAIVLYDNGSGALTAKAYTNFYPTAYLGNPGSTPPGAVSTPTTLNTKTYATANVMPRANVACMWGNFLVLGDVEWFIDQSLPLSSTNVKRYANALWISTVDNNGVPAPDRFLPTESMNFIGTPESVVRGLQVIDRGLLVFTSSATAGDGVILLRGTPPTGDGTASYIPEVLRGGMGAVLPTVDQYSPMHALWPEAGSIVFVEDKGTVWSTNGGDLGRLDRYGPAAPTSATQDDHVAAVGPYLLLARAGRLLSMRMYQEEGAWTELVTPGDAPVKSMSVSEDCVYFVAAGVIYRYALAGTARGRINGSLVDLTVSTQTLGDPNEHTLHSWFRAGVRVTGLESGTVKSVSSAAGAALLSPAADALTTTLNEAVSTRDEVLVRGHGPSLEASVTAVFQGDVIVESVTVWAHGKEPSR